MRIVIIISLICSSFSIHGQVDETKLKPIDPFAIKDIYGINPFHSENSLISDSILISDLERQLKNYYFIKEEKIKKFFETPINLEEKFGSDSLNESNYFHTNIKWEDQWKLVAFQEFLWRQQGKALPIVKKDASYYDVSKTNKSYPTSELLEFCSLSETKFNTEFPLNYVPEINEQNHSFNFKWTISYFPCKIEKCKELGMYTASIPNNLFCEEYHSEFLLVRYVNNYPYGGATSCYEEKVFFFKKVN